MIDEKSEISPDDGIAREIKDKVQRAIESDVPLFLIVYYDHEAAKIAFIETLRKYLFDHGASSQSFDPGIRPEHGPGKLYPLISEASGSGAVCLITSLPRIQNTSALDTSFLDYLNLHRDLISREKLRLILFLHTVEAERFITSAGDLWDFRDHTYWLESERRAETSLLWRLPEQEPNRIELPESSRDEIVNHLQAVHALVDETSAPREKAELLFDLTQWLSRRNAASLAAEAALAGIHLISDDRSRLRADLEHGLGPALQLSANPAEALHHYEKCLEIQKEIGDRAGQGITLNNISLVFGAWGQYDKALKTLEQSLAIRRESGDRTGEGTTLNNISSIYRAWGRYDEALKLQEQSLVIYRETGNRTRELVALSNISTIYHDWGRYDDALRILTQSLAIIREIGDRAAEGMMLNNIGQIHKTSGRYDEALKVLEQSLSILRENGNRAGEGASLTNISQIYHAWGRCGEAMKALEQSLLITREIGDPESEALVLNNMSQIYTALGQHDKTMEVLEKGLAITREIGNLPGEGSVCWNLALEFKRRGDLNKAISFANRAVEIRTRTNHPSLAKNRKFLTELENRLKQNS